MAIRLPSTSFEFSRLPVTVVDRFISLVPDSSLDDFSRISKINYRRCILLRGIPVNQAIRNGRHLIYNKQGKWILGLSQIPLAWLPFLHCDSVFYLDGFVEDDNDIKDYPVTRSFRYIDAGGYGPTFDFILNKCLNPEVRQLYLDFRMIPIPEELERLFSQLLKVEILSLALTVHEENNHEYLEMAEIAECWSTKYSNLRSFYFSISHGKKIFFAIKKTKIMKIRKLEITAALEAIPFVVRNYCSQKDEIMTVIIEDLITKNQVSTMVAKLKRVKFLNVVLKQFRYGDDWMPKELVLRFREGRQRRKQI